ncbi:hypothetical protein SAMN05216404_11624 [Nitrosospira multiformis]|uniref:Uncharacterized protein n=1 Tax=Nitrosospira multiformis TaxID=1231 RepID=A0A1H8NF40_9PROT|nr:hypothetical protein SAMN05216404_11624 [Nitrosospira multiformis]
MNPHLFSIWVVLFLASTEGSPTPDLLRNQYRSKVENSGFVGLPTDIGE